MALLTPFPNPVEDNSTEQPGRHFEEPPSINALTEDQTGGQRRAPEEERPYRSYLRPANSQL